MVEIYTGWEALENNKRESNEKKVKVRLFSIDFFPYARNVYVSTTQKISI